MNRILLLLILGAACATADAGELSASLVGVANVSARGGLQPLSGGTLTVAVDSFWGQPNQQAFDRFKEQHGALPEITLKGDGVTDDKGKFDFKVTASWGENEVMPTRTVRRRGGSDEEVVYVYLVVTLAAEGWLSSTVATSVFDGTRHGVYFSRMVRETVIEGRVRSLETLEPVGNLQLSVEGYYRPPPARPGASWQSTPDEYRAHTFRTDAEGNFRVGGYDVPYNIAVMRVVDSGLAFSYTSQAWKVFQVKKDDNNKIAMGDLFVVPGGQVRARLVDMDTGEPLQGSAGVSTPEQRYWQAAGKTNQEGWITIRGVPAGNYFGRAVADNPPSVGSGRRTGAADEYWPTEPVQVSVRAGEVTELGALQCEPIRHVEIFAVTEEGAGIESFEARITTTSDRNPDHTDGDRKIPYSRASRLTVEENRLERLFGGEWVLTVSAPGYAEAIVTVQLPVQEPIRVSLTRGGNLEVTAVNLLGESKSWLSCCAVRRGTPAHDTFMEWLKERESNPNDRDRRGVVWEAWRQIAPAGGYVLTTQRQGEAGGMKRNDLPVGTYTVAAWHDFLMVREDVEIALGRTTLVALSPPPATLLARVMERGIPKPGVRLHVVATDHRLGTDESPTSTPIISGADGVARFEAKTPTTVAIVTEGEYEWVRSLPKEAWQHWFRNTFEDRQKVLYNDRVERQDFELYDPENVLVRVQLECEQEIGVEFMSLAADDAVVRHEVRHRKYFQSFNKGLAHIFARVPSGEYRLQAALKRPDDTLLTLDSKVAVHEAPEQRIVIRFRINSLLVRVKAPGEALSAGYVSVTLRAPESTPHAGATMGGTNGRHEGLIADAQGRVTVALVDQGNWHVIAKLQKPSDSGHPHVIRSVAKSIYVSGDTVVDLDLVSEVGSLAIALKAVGERHEMLTRVYVYGPNGEEVLPGDPWLAFGSAEGNQNGTDIRRRWDTKVQVPFVPVGTYTVVLAASGFLPVTWNDVKIEKDKVTDFSTQLSSACSLVIEVADPDWETPLWQLEWSAENQAGEEVKLLDPGLGVVEIQGVPVVRSHRIELAMAIEQARKLAEFRRNAGEGVPPLQIAVGNMTPDVKRLHLKLPGYREVTVNINFEAAAHEVVRVKLEKE